MNPADAHALSLIGAVEPVFTGLARAHDVIDLPDRFILHAGPPLGVEKLPVAILNSACVAAMFEGWAGSDSEARDILLAGEVHLAPAQDHSAVVPLASVLSPSMWVQCVSDDRTKSHSTYSPINGGAGPALRLGLCNDDVLDHLKWLNGDFADWFNTVLDARGIPLIPLADFGLEQGDDCHGRTAAATTRLIDLLLAGTADGEVEDKIGSFLRDGPSFFLNLWMAATKCMLTAAAGIEGSSAITAIGGNGIAFGLQLAGRPGSWITTPAMVPDGVFDHGYSETDGIGAIGDSAVIDTFGLGAMSVWYSPLQAEALGPVLPKKVQQLPMTLLGVIHKGFNRVSPLYGLTARRVVDTGLSPVIALGIIDKAGNNGRIGGGIYRPPVSVFEDAISGL